MRSRCRILVVLLATAWLHAESNDSLETLKDAEAKVETKLAKFSETKDVELLVEARKLASSINRRGWTNALSKLDEGSLRLQLKVLLALAAARDPHYDRNAQTNAFYLNMVPPGGRYTSGIAPEGIKEPEVRKAYEQVLAENLRRNRKMNREMAISRELDNAVMLLWLFANRGLVREHSPARTAAFDIIEKAVSDKAILRRLRSDSMPGLTW